MHAAGEALDHSSRGHVAGQWPGAHACKGAGIVISRHRAIRRLVSICRIVVWQGWVEDLVPRVLKQTLHSTGSAQLRLAVTEEVTPLDDAVHQDYARLARDPLQIQDLIRGLNRVSELSRDNLKERALTWHQTGSRTRPRSPMQNFIDPEHGGLTEPMWGARA